MIDRVPFLQRTLKTVRACLAARHIFFCHYEHPATFTAVVALRLLLRRVYVMNDSKFDDYERYLWREVGKAIMYMPYRGGIASGTRARDYLRFLGVPRNGITGNYNSLSVERVRRLAKAPPAPAGAPWIQRHFTIVARFVLLGDVGHFAEAVAALIAR
jgi:L-malate glycosyltransferase